MNRCACGCGYFISRAALYAKGHQRKHEAKLLKTGCLPAKKLEFDFCEYCHSEFIRLKGDRRITCTQFNGSKCQQMQGARKRGKIKEPKDLKTVLKKRGTRPAHIQTYCIQRAGQCAKYDEGFDIDNIDAGCWGREYNGKCYVRPKSRTEKASTMSEHVVTVRSPKTYLRR